MREVAARAATSCSRSLRLAPFRDRLADRLSGGMKQKLALACTLIHTPELLVPRRADDRRRSGLAPGLLEDPARLLSATGITILLTTPLPGRGGAVRAGSR